MIGPLPERDRKEDAADLGTFRGEMPRRGGEGREVKSIPRARDLRRTRQLVRQFKERFTGSPLPVDEPDARVRARILKLEAREELIDRRHEEQRAELAEIESLVREATDGR